MGEPDRLIVRSGTVVSVRDGMCRVALRRDHCAICPAKDGADGGRRCGVGFAFPREVALSATGAAPGDCVLVGVSSVGMSIAASIVFGLPLSLMLAAAALAQALWSAALAGAVFGLVGGGILSLLFARRKGLDDWVEPVLVEVRRRQDSAGARM